MCLIITATVPRTALSGAFSEVVEKHRLSFTPCDNRHIEAQLPQSERYVCATSTSCDCGSPLFTGERPASAEALARQLDKLRKRNWSETKIKRWLKATTPHPTGTKASRQGQLSVSDWAAFLDEALSLPTTPHIGLIGHTYQGDLSTEEFTLATRMAHTVADSLRASDFQLLAEDVVHEFRGATLSLDVR